jgi:hypothetical protein
LQSSNHILSDLVFQDVAIVFRQETAKPLLDEIRSKIDAAQSIALPSGALSKACQYAHTLEELTRFLELELRNNLAKKFNASRGSGSQELDTHRQSNGRTEVGRRS